MELPASVIIGENLFSHVQGSIKVPPMLKLPPELYRWISRMVSHHFRKLSEIDRHPVWLDRKDQNLRGDL